MSTHRARGTPRASYPKTGGSSAPWPDGGDEHRGMPRALATDNLIGEGYALTRREDPHISSTIRSALGDARSVVNFGAGTGSYEPDDRYVIAVEPSDVMAAQRPPTIPPALRAGAAELPLRDYGHLPKLDAFDAGLRLTVSATA